MVILKSIVFIAFATTLISCEDVSLRPKQQIYIEKPLASLKQERAIVVSSNLPEEDQQDVALKLQEIYDRSDDPLTRTIEFMNYVDNKYPETLNNVVLNYDGAAYDQKFYIVLSITGENVLAYGL